jgi:hypothetical protein
MSTHYVLPTEFRFYHSENGVYLGKIKCEYKSELFGTLVAAGYTWECPWHTYRSWPVSLNWLRISSQP